MEKKRFQLLLGLVGLAILIALTGVLYYHLVYFPKKVAEARVFAAKQEAEQEKAKQQEYAQNQSKFLQCKQDIIQRYSIIWNRHCEIADSHCDGREVVRNY